MFVEKWLQLHSNTEVRTPTILISDHSPEPTGSNNKSKVNRNTVKLWEECTLHAGLSDTFKFKKGRYLIGKYNWFLITFCTLPKAISYGNWRMKIQHNIRVKRSKLILIGEELPSLNFSMVNFVTNPLFQFLPKGWIPLPNSSMASLVSIPLFKFLSLGKPPFPILQC